VFLSNPPTKCPTEEASFSDNLAGQFGDFQSHGPTTDSESKIREAISMKDGLI